MWNNCSPSFKDCLAKISSISCDYNHAKGFMNISFANDKSSRKVFINSTVEIYESLEKLIGYVKILLPEHEWDSDYRKELFRFVLDAEKSFKGAYSNNVLRFIMESFYKSITYDPKFPFAKVVTCTSANVDFP